MNLTQMTIISTTVGKNPLDGQESLRRKRLAIIVNKAEIDVFLELSCFFDDPVDVGNLVSGSSTFSKTSLNIRKFTVNVLLKPGLENLDRKSTRLNSSHH